MFLSNYEDKNTLPKRLFFLVFSIIFVTLSYLPRLNSILFLFKKMYRFRLSGYVFSFKVFDLPASTEYSFKLTNFIINRSENSPICCYFIVGQ